MSGTTSRAFVYINSGGAYGDGTHYGTIGASGVMLDADEIPTGIGGSVRIDHTDSSQSIHERLADNIRENASDPDLVVIFLDSPGRY
jgi:hypothetical protein